MREDVGHFTPVCLKIIITHIMHKAKHEHDIDQLIKLGIVVADYIMSV